MSIGTFLSLPLIPFKRQCVTLCSSPTTPQANHESVKLSDARSCLCGRRRFIEATATATAFLPFCPRASLAFDSDSDYRAVLNRVHPPRADWNEEFYASVMNSGMKSYESEIAEVKAQLFSNLREKTQKVLELGIGAGPNLKYYGRNSGVQVFGLDPNRQMEKYARAAAMEAGLPPESFDFRQAVGEAIPLPDASVNAVVGTLVLCSVKDVILTLKEVKRVLRPGGVYVYIEHVAASGIVSRDIYWFSGDLFTFKKNEEAFFIYGTTLRLIQNFLDPVQQKLADGCHLTRETGRNIAEAGFSNVNLDTIFLSNTLFINPQVYENGNGSAKPKNMFPKL